MQSEKSKIKPYFEHLQATLPDHRDTRGRIHDLAFVMCGVLIAILHGRKTPSSIQRFMSNRQSDLEQWTGYKVDSIISNPQLGRVTKGLDWATYNSANEAYFNVRVVEKSDSEWIALDGKDLKGSLAVNASDGKKEKRGEVLVNAVRHSDKKSVGHTYYRGDKESEKIHVRELLEKQDLAGEKVTMDALHCNPLTTQLIEGHGGVYLIQVKGDQKKLLAQLKKGAERLPCLYNKETIDKGHGRIERRRNQLYSIEHLKFADRWTNSCIKTLVVTHRHFIEVKTQKEQQETSYRISNQPIRRGDFDTMHDLAGAVRGHWSVEADNHVRDVTLLEDKIKTAKGNSSRIWASCRLASLNIIRDFQPENIVAKIESWIDKPKQFFTEFQGIGFF